MARINSSRTGAKCPLCNTPIWFDDIKLREWCVGCGGYSKKITREDTHKTARKPRKH